MSLLLGLKVDSQSNILRTRKIEWEQMFDFVYYHGKQYSLIWMEKKKVARTRRAEGREGGGAVVQRATRDYDLSASAPNKNSR